jgi:hypothetical protein
MTKIFFLFLLISFNATVHAVYYGAKSTEAILTFNGLIEISGQPALDLSMLNGQSRQSKQIREKIDYQLSFLIGHFQSDSFIKTFNYPGVVGDQQQVKYIKVEQLTANSQIIYYSYEGKVNFHSEAFSNKRITVPIRLPRNPGVFYKKGLMGGTNRCTDAKYNSEGDLFYFWDPDKRGCPLKDNQIDVLRLEGVMNQLPNTTSTYPEYDQLYNQSQLKLAIMIGYIEDEPLKTRKKDTGFTTYREIRNELLNQNFKVTEERNFKQINYLTILQKEVRNQLGVKQNVEITLLLSDASLGISDKTFEQYFKTALMKSHIVAYDGHSGLGGNLDINRFSINKLPSFYQIYFFNGCSSYPYFNQNYFSRKPGGTRNLEIITSGLPTLTSTSTSNMLAFIHPFIHGKIHSYQNLLNSIERSNGRQDTYLMGVNGDEDNRFRP